MSPLRSALPWPARLMRRALPLVAAVAMAVTCFSPPIALAAVIDYDPGTQPAPEILDPDGLALLDQAMAADLVYLLSPISPDGGYVFAYVDGEVGFIALPSGAFVPLPEEGPPGRPVTDRQWVGDHALAALHVQVEEQAEGEPPLVTSFWVEIDARDGALMVREIDLAGHEQSIVAAGPGLQTLLVLELPPQAPPARVVDVGESFGSGPRDGAPDGLPGRIGARPLGPMSLQQAAFTLVLRDLDGSNRRELLSLPPDSGLQGITWSADGTRLALTTRTMPGWQPARPRGNAPPVEGTPNLGSVNVREALGLLPPLDNPLVTGTELHVFAADSGDRLATIANTDHQQGLIAGLEFSPSGRRALLFLLARSELEGRPQPTYAYPSGLELWLLDETFAAEGRLAAPGMDLLAGGGAFLDDERLLWVTADELDNTMGVLNLDSGHWSPVWERDGGLLQVLVHDGRAVFSHSDPERPWELWAGEVPADGGTLEASPLTAFYPQALEIGSRLRAQPVSWRASDGSAIHGVYVHHVDQPFPPPEPGPLVVWQQGGPGGQMTRDYGATVESPYSILPHFGLPVLIANAAGRTVKSRDFFSSLAHGDNFGQIDIAQLKDGVDALARRGIVHPGRVGITGCSYGGYFTLQSLRAYPDVYAAGNAQCSLVDLTEEFTFGYAPFIAYLMGRSPMADAAEYQRDSPYYGAGDIRSKLLLFHGAEDFLPVQLVNNLHDELDGGGVPVTFLRVAGEGHGFAHAESQRYAAQLQVSFFREHLIEADVGPAPTYGRTVFLPASYNRAAP